MSLISAVAGSIARLGGEVAITDDSRRSEMHQLGQASREKYLFIGTPDISLQQNRSVIESVGGKYIVKRCETYFVRDKAVYVWAILAPFGDSREDEYEPDF